ncbi:MAG: hypothetical protein AABW49_04165 [Nanoarchaeota archaeon]
MKGGFRSLLLVVIVISISELLLKQQAETIEFIPGNIIQSGIAIISNGWIWLAAGLLIASSILWITTLSKVELSLAYPLLALGMAIISVLSVVILKEQISLVRGTGVGVIIIGVILLSKS